jgi:tetratricopeptide (TPR) repeat protein
VRRGRTLVLVASALVVATVAGSILHVREGDLAVVSWRGGGTPDLREPGLSLRVPLLQRVEVYPKATITVRNSLATASREGSALEIPYAVKAQPDPQTLLQLHRDGGEEGAPAAVRALVEAEIKKAATAIGTYDLASGASTGTVAQSVKRALDDKLGPRLEVSIERAILPPEVRASFDRAAIYGLRKETDVRVVLVGIDGADWDVIDELIARGRVPNLARLKREGAWARLRSSVPMLSPLLWTTAATGKTPDRHGINDFLVTDPRTGQRVPINSTFRRTKAIWNILTEAGLPSDIIAWWATWPAESISGHLVSDRVAYSTFALSGREQKQGAVHPAEYAPVVESLRVRPESVTYAQIARFLHISPEEFRRARAPATRRDAGGEQNGGEGSAGGNETDVSINVMARVLGATETYRRVALDLLDRESQEATPARLFAVYFQGVDEVGHRFAHCAPPQEALCTGGDYRRFKDAVAEFYAYQDGILGEILRRAPGALVIVMSDHGFASGAKRPRDDKPFIEGKPGLWHDLFGIFIVQGSLAKRGEIDPVTLLDIAPTILYLLGLPIPEDMPGNVVESALSPEFVAAHPITHVPSYESLEAPGRPAPAPVAGYAGEGNEAAEREIKEQLRALGYIGGGEEAVLTSSAPPSVKSGAQDPTRRAATEGVGGAPGGVPTLLYHTNLGGVYVSKKQYEQARAEFEKALRIDPSSIPALSGMAAVEEARGNLDGAISYLQAIVKMETGADHATVIRIASLFGRIGKAEDGLAYLKGLEPGHRQGDQRELGLRVGLGMLYSATGRPKEAETALLRALAIEPTSVAAMQELFALYDGQGRSAQLQPLLQTALRRNPRSAMHHNWLGLVLKRQGDLKAAEAEFRKTLEAAPDLVGAMANLGSLYLQEGRLDDAVTVLRQAIVKDSRNPESRTNLIVALGMKHDLEGARQVVKDAESAGQRAPMFYNALAYALHVNGRSQEALESLRESLRIDPQQADALRLQAEIERGRPASGVPYH